MEQDRKLTAYLEDLARAAERTGGARFSRFLDPAGGGAAKAAAVREGVHIALWGGYPDAERVVACFRADPTSGEEEWPIACLRATWSRRASAPAHRDLLGAQMALGLNRDCFGDIAAGPEEAYLFVAREVAGYVLGNLPEAGSTRLQLEEADTVPDPLPEPEGKTVRETVGSMRLDAVVAAAWNLSRSEAQTLILRELAKVNHVVTARTDARVEQGDLLSVRGLGRARVKEVCGLTRKGRIAVQLLLYGNN